MNMPDLMETQQEPIVTTTFKGYNHNAIIEDGEMYDMRNLSGKSYPLLDQRKKRLVMSFDGDEELTGIHGRDKLVFTRGNRIWYGDQMVGDETFTVSEDGPKQIVSMGAYTCIWPDKVYFNTADLTDYGDMGFDWEATPTGLKEIRFCMCRVDGTEYDYSAITVSSTAPSSPTAGQLWIDTSKSTCVLKQYVASSGWTEVASTYVLISATGIGKGLKEYDTVSISGLAGVNYVPASSHFDPVTGTTVVIPEGQAMEFGNNDVEELNGSAIIYACGDDYIVIAGLVRRVQYQRVNQKVSVKLAIPDLDFVCESNNRLWGCKYGLENGVTVNEIRACKLGNFRNWQSFMGLSTDSYTASIGTDGPWTGCVTQKGYPVFFKENCIHRVSGSVPSNYSIATTMCRGIQEGSWRSCVVTNETIIYKSRTDIMSYDGSIPQSISTALGGGLYSNGRAGAIGGKYYISMQDAAGEWALFMFDMKTGLWYREDNLHALGFGTVQDELYAIDEGNDTLLAMTGTVPILTENQDVTVEAEPDLDWMAEFGLFGTDYTGQKYLSRFNLRMQMEPWATVHLYIQYDQDGEWHDEGEIRGVSTKTFMIPVVPRRCDHLQLKLEGHGECRIYSLSRMLEVGTDG